MFPPNCLQRKCDTANAPKRVKQRVLRGQNGRLPTTARLNDKIADSESTCARIQWANTESRHAIPQHINEYSQIDKSTARTYEHSIAHVAFRLSLPPALLPTTSLIMSFMPLPFLLTSFFHALAFPPSNSTAALVQNLC